MQVIAHNTQVSRQTLKDRADGRHKSHQDAASHLQLLTPAEEQVVLDWCEHSSLSAKPLGPQELRTHAFAISGKHPGKRWHYKYSKRHPQLVMSKPCGLDPKRANNFNKNIVSDYFTKCQELEDKYGGIPPENHWNMDEKGIQMGGGRKNDGRKFFFMRNCKQRYRIKSDNLELVTVIEGMSAARCLLPPAFILADGPMPDCRDLEGVGRYEFDQLLCRQ